MVPSLRVIEEYTISYSKELLVFWTKSVKYATTTSCTIIYSYYVVVRSLTTKPSYRVCVPTHPIYLDLNTIAICTNPEAPCYCRFLFIFQIFSSAPVSKHPPFSIRARTHTTRSEIIILYVLIFGCLDRRRKDKPVLMPRSVN
jgi:hypothetical protein